MSNDFYFILEGDIHAHVVDGKNSIQPYKTKPDERFKKISSRYPLDLALCAGDLTNNGFDGTTGNIFESCISHQSNRTDNELNAFKNLYLDPIKNAGIPIYLCIGNHDMPAGHKGVGEYVQNRHNTTWPWFKSKWYGGCYKFKHKGVVFLCLGIWPNDLKWLSDNLPTKGDPVIIWYHYNTPIGEQWSDFWSVEDKFKFADTVAGHNILCICNGHSHSTMLGMFSNIYTIRGSGARAAIIHIKDNKLHGVYFDQGTSMYVSTVNQKARFDKWLVLDDDDIKKYNIDNRNV